MDERVFRDSPLAQEYLYYVQDMLQKGAGLEDITTPEEYYMRYMKGDPREQTLASMETTDPRYTAIKRIYDVLREGR